MCGDGGQPAGTLAVVAPSSSSALFTDVWTRNYHFSNERWDSSTNRFGPSSSITGNIHNSSDIAAENVVVEAIGYAEGRSPQTRRQTIASINANDATLVTFDFDFSVSVTGWDVRVVEWE